MAAEKLNARPYHTTQFSINSSLSDIVKHATNVYAVIYNALS